MNFKFYRENKIDQEYELSLDDLKFLVLEIFFSNYFFF